MILIITCFLLSVPSRPLLHKLFFKYSRPKSCSCLLGCLFFAKSVLIGTICFPELSLYNISRIFCLLWPLCQRGSGNERLQRALEEQLSTSQQSLFFPLPAHSVLILFIFPFPSPLCCCDGGCTRAYPAPENKHLGVVLGIPKVSAVWITPHVG